MAPPGENQKPISEIEKSQEEQRLEGEILNLQMQLLGVRDPEARKKINDSLAALQKDLQKLREEREQREKSITTGAGGPEEQAAQILGRHLGRLEALEGTTERPPGFAKLPELSDEFKALESLSAEERFQILRATLSQKIEVTDERVRKQKEFLLLKLSYLQLLADQLTKGRMFKASSTWSDQWASFLKSEPYAVKSWFQENFQDLIGKIMADEKFDLVAAIPPKIKGLLENLSGKKLEDLKTKEAVYERYAATIKAMRDDSDYEAAQELMEELLADEFEKGKNKLGRAWIDQIKAQVARGKIFQLYVGNQDAWKKAGMNDEQILDYYHELLRIEEGREINKRVAQYILGNTVSIPPEKRVIWEHYQAMLDPKHEWFNVSDEHWDTAMHEIAINAPLILLSGGIASLARAGISRVGMSILERQGAKLLGQEVFQQTILRRAISRGIVWGARKGGGLLVEGAVFDATHKTLTGEQYHSLPDWAQSVIWSSISLGVFHGSGKISERLFTKHIGNLPVNTWLGAKLAHITVTPVREAAKVLLIKGHIEAATMLFIGAVQNKAYTGSLQEFMDNIGNEILHAYITVGALKISGVTMGSVMRKLTLAPKQQRVELDQPGREEILRRLQDPKVSRGEKQRILEALREHCSEELGSKSWLGQRVQELFPESKSQIRSTHPEPAQQLDADKRFTQPVLEKKSEEFESMKENLRDHLPSTDDLGDGDYREFWSFREGLSTVLKRTTFPHDLPKLVRESGFLETLKKVTTSNIEWLNQSGPLGSAMRDNLSENLHAFFQEIPFELRAFIAQELKPLFEKIQDWELAGRWKEELETLEGGNENLYGSSPGNLLAASVSPHDSYGEGPPMTPEEARKVRWYSSNTDVGEKITPDGKTVYGLSLTTNPYYAQTYARDNRVNVFDLSSVRLKPVTFTYGMTIDAPKAQKILSEGYDGVIFEGMGGPEVALLRDVVKLEGQITPIPPGIQSLIDAHRSIPESVVQRYSIHLPDGYILEGDRYIFKR